VRQRQHVRNWLGRSSLHIGEERVRRAKPFGIK
jgi:hypothetical protein